MRFNLSAIVLLFTMLVCHGQDSLRFKVEFLPNRVYETQMKINSTSEMTFTADEETLRQLEESGIEMPVIMEQEIESSMIANNGSRDEDGNIPVMLSYNKTIVKSTVNGKATIEEKPSTEMDIFGRYNSDNQLEVDSIAGKEIDETTKALIKSLLAQVSENVKFPDRALKIGDQFTNSMPMSIPVSDLKPVNVFIETIYTLDSIKDEKAYFLVEQTVSLDASFDQGNVEASGSGGGTMEFDMKTNHMSRFVVDMPMLMKIQVTEIISIEANMEAYTETLINIK